MSSRKKITIAFIAIILVVIASTVAIVSVLAADKQIAKSGFKVSYNASGAVAATVSARYKKSPIITDAKKPATFTTTDGSVLIGEHTFGRYHEEGEISLNSEEISIDYDETNLSLLFEFVFTNNAESHIGIELTVVDVKDKDGNETTLTDQNLGVKIYDDIDTKNWIDLPAGGYSDMVLGVIENVQRRYVQVYVLDPNKNVSNISFNFNWDLTAR